MEFILFILLGSTIGILSGFFGIGGGIILTPLLLILGYPASTAIVLSLLLTLGSTVTGTVSHMRLKNFHVRDALAVGLSDRRFCRHHAGRLLARTTDWSRCHDFCPLHSLVDVVCDSVLKTIETKTSRRTYHTSESL